DRLPGLVLGDGFLDGLLDGLLDRRGLHGLDGGGLERFDLNLIPERRRVGGDVLDRGGVGRRRDLAGQPGGLDRLDAPVAGGGLCRDRVLHRLGDGLFLLHFLAGPAGGGGGLYDRPGLRGLDAGVGQRRIGQLPGSAAGGVGHDRTAGQFGGDFEGFVAGGGRLDRRRVEGRDLWLERRLRVIQAPLRCLRRGVPDGIGGRRFAGGLGTGLALVGSHGLDQEAAEVHV